MPRVWSRDQSLLVASLAGGVLLRCAAITVGPGYPFDVVTFQRWAARMAAGGPAAFYDPNQFADYPPGLLYLLWPLGSLPGDVPSWAVRAIGIPFDVALAFAIFAVVSRIRGSRGGLLAASAYALNPALALAGPFWGQVDAVAMLPLFLSLVAAAAGRHARAGTLAAVAAMVKPQAAIGLGVLMIAGAAAAAKRGEWRRLMVTGGAATVTVVILLAPFAPSAERVGAFVRDATSPHPFSSLFAFNVWALAVGFGMHDDTPMFGLPIRLWGLLLVAVALVLIGMRLWSLVPRRSQPWDFSRELAAYLAITTLAALAVYELPTRIHERYLFAAFAVLVPFVGVSRRAGLAYATLSVVLAVSVLFSFTHQAQTQARAPDLVERTLFDPSMLVLFVLTGLGAAAMLAIDWARREPRLARFQDEPPL
ncbi:MAG: glycosyltransferase 87 family protein [Chloroflexota bacterium]|nr:glycosyltransferase 87 family protein [Chloroflexota bacterium]